METGNNKTQNALENNDIKPIKSGRVKLDEFLQTIPPWIVLTLIALFFLLILCLLPIIIIDATKQWCNLFPDFFNAITPGACP